MEYLKESFNVLMPINITQEKWDSIFGNKNQTEIEEVEETE